MAQAATVTTSGTWTSAVGTQSPIGGIGTNQISWGTAATGNGQSGYNFTGESNVTAPLNGSSFLLGTFTHFNWPITGNTLANANLGVNFTGAFNKTFNFAFSHNETPNNVPGTVCPATPGYSEPCPDVVSIPSLSSTELVSIGGFDYNLTIEGFKPDASSSPVSQFITIEQRANSAGLYGKLVQVQATPPSPNVPEPMTILGSATALVFGGVLKRKQSQAQKEKVNA
ncbi:MAG: THxN family PEP-CTERM protein [Gloeotrichia echinulata GP01]